MTKDEALKLALEALEESKTNNDSMEFHDRKNKAINKCKEALAQPEQKPEWHHFIRRGEDCFVPYKGQAPEDATPLYTTPPAQREWVGLTDEEVKNLWLSVGAEPIEVRLIEAKLKEKNT